MADIGVEQSFNTTHSRQKHRSANTVVNDASQGRPTPETTVRSFFSKSSMDIIVSVSDKDRQKYRSPRRTVGRW